MREREKTTQTGEKNTNFTSQMAGCLWYDVNQNTHVLDPCTVGRAGVSIDPLSITEYPIEELCHNCLA